MQKKKSEYIGNCKRKKCLCKINLVK